jgi:hypothetical protein
MRSPPTRFLILILLMPLGWWLYLQSRASWQAYWILNDCQQGIAVITKEFWGGHGRLVYRYAVNGKQFTGVSSPDWKDAKYRNVKIGEEAVVYYSASHPWLSLLHKPEGFIQLLPALIALTLVGFIVVTAIKPKSKWALNVDAA